VKSQKKKKNNQQGKLESNTAEQTRR